MTKHAVLPKSPVWVLVDPQSPIDPKLKRTPIHDAWVNGKWSDVEVECDCKLGGAHERWCELWRPYTSEQG